MNNHLASRLRRLVAKEAVKKSLLSYFEKKGYEGYDSLVYPPAVMDIGSLLPELHNKIEVVPFVENQDPTTGIVKIGWNMFILGIHRMYLGKSTHTSLAELNHAMYGNSINEGHGEPEHSAREIIEFTLRMLDNSENGYEILPKSISTPAQNSPHSPMNRPKIGPTMSGGYYERNKIA